MSSGVSGPRSRWTSAATVPIALYGRRLAAEGTRTPDVTRIPTRAGRRAPETAVAAVGPVQTPAGRPAGARPRVPTARPA